MRGLPPCEVTVVRFAAWRTAVAVVAAAALLSLAAWLLTSPLGESAWVRGAVAAAALATLALAASLWRVPPVRLVWDGFGWSVAPVSGAEPATSGTLDVAVDLGAFLLLRFVAVGRRGPGGLRWIPVGRAGLEREWHAFRCAVYSPRPVAADPRQP
ncbi:MAG: hypothetical protein K8R60_12890 [Burkholderiales bacterium]|nr:hypothetical protein [Burkholderiales bacterium]